MTDYDVEDSVFPKLFGVVGKMDNQSESLPYIGLYAVFIVRLSAGVGRKERVV